MKSRAFTLIELLVVVLIISILAAIALPQYRVAVLKARTVEAMVQLNALEKAQIVYKLANGSYATSLDDLDIEVKSVTSASLAGYGGVHVPGGDMYLEWVWPNPSSWPQGEHRCVGYTSSGKQVCKSMGGVEIDKRENSETTQYYKLP